MTASQTSTFDFFIAYARPDNQKAREIHLLLSKDHSVFLDTDNLQHSDNWTTRIPSALENSKSIIILLSKHSPAAYYLNEEIARSVHIYRSNKNWYKVIPVYLDGFPNSVSEIPYGLYQLHSIDYLAEGSAENVCNKLLSYYDSGISSKESSIEKKNELQFKHVLHQFPVGPMVSGHLLPTIVIDSFAEAINVTDSFQVVDEANAFRNAANPHEKASILIKKINLPSPLLVSPREFWNRVFTQAKLHGPRMLAALLLTADDTFWPKEAIIEKNKLLDILKNFDH